MSIALTTRPPSCLRRCKKKDGISGSPPQDWWPCENPISVKRSFISPSENLPSSLPYLHIRVVSSTQTKPLKYANSRLYLTLPVGLILTESLGPTLSINLGLNLILILNFTIGHRHAQVLYPKIEEQYALYHNITVLVECRKVEMWFQGVKYVLMLGYVFLYISGYIQCVNSLDNNLHNLNFY
jgi:hypothetical protein